MKKILIIINSLIISGVMLSAVPALAYDPLASVCQNATSSPACQDSASPSNPASLLKTVINIISIAVGVVAVIMLIVGGLLFTISGGDSAKVATARNTVIYALVGLAIAVLAQVIIHFVLSNLGNSL